MLFAEHRVVVRGGGDLATGVVARLHRAGFPLVVLELPTPLAIRRAVSVARAVSEGAAVIEDLSARLVNTPGEALEVGATGAIPVLVGEHLPAFPEPVSVLVDARLAKRTLDTSIDQAPLVVALGPGFVAGVDCHAVVETNRGHRMGRVIWSGTVEPDTQVPDPVAGQAVDRVLRAPAAGVFEGRARLADRVKRGDLLGVVERVGLRAQFDGVLRGLLHDGVEVQAGLKVGDLDPRNDPELCHLISDKALAVGGGVLEALLTRPEIRRRLVEG